MLMQITGGSDSIEWWSVDMLATSSGVRKDAQGVRQNDHYSKVWMG